MIVTRTQEEIEDIEEQEIETVVALEADEESQNEWMDGWRRNYWRGEI